MEIRALTPEFLEKISVEARAATFEDLERLLRAGWLVGIDLKAVILNGLSRSEYLGRMAVDFDMDADKYWLHDPGLKPRPNRKISRQKLADAWFWSGRENAGLVAVKS